MRANEPHIPYGAYWSTPFARWQGALAHLHSLEFAAHVAKASLSAREIPAEVIDYGVLGTTVPQAHCFYGLPWVTGRMGAPHVPGPTINHACATGARCLQSAADEVRAGSAECALVLTADRTSNGPHVYYPAPAAMGGTGAHENWVLDNFSCDPFARVSMVETAENVAREYQISTEAQHEVVLMRYEQYERARQAQFQARYMSTSFEVPDARLRRTQATLNGDEGIVATDAEKLSRLDPVLEGGTVTFAGQTHPADGNVGMLVTTSERAKLLSARPEITIRIRGFGLARAEVAHMPKAPVPAAQRALQAAEVDLDEVALVTTHNPFALNDIVFAHETGFELERMNPHGCSLIWGHPQGPTGLRSTVELIEGLVERGGGIGLFTGCAAGDSAMALVLEVDG